MTIATDSLWVSFNYGDTESCEYGKPLGGGLGHFYATCKNGHSVCLCDDAAREIKEANDRGENAAGFDFDNPDDSVTRDALGHVLDLLELVYLNLPCPSCQPVDWNCPECGTHAVTDHADDCSTVDAGPTPRERAAALIETSHTHRGEVWECSRDCYEGGTFCWGCIAMHNWHIHGVGRSPCLPCKRDGLIRQAQLLYGTGGIDDTPLCIDHAFEDGLNPALLRTFNGVWLQITVVPGHSCHICGGLTTNRCYECQKTICVGTCSNHHRDENHANTSGRSSTR